MFLLLNVLLFLGGGEAARILVVQPIGTRSHMNSIVPLVGELATRGHELTYITFAKSGLKSPNVDEVIFKPGAEVLQSMFPDFFKDREDRLAKIKMFSKSISVMKEATVGFYNDPEVLGIIEKDYDLVIFSLVMTDALIPVATQKGTPFIMVSPNILFNGYQSIFGVPDSTAYVPNLFLEMLAPMNFLQRVQNALLNGITTVFSQFISYQHGLLIKQYFPNVEVGEQTKKASAVFVNTHVTTAYPLANPPGIIEVGGIHCRPAKELPQDLEDFIQNSDDGFIFLSLGSAIPVSSMANTTKDAIFSVFSKLRQSVIVKWEGEAPDNVPKNVKLLKWVPQQDLLGHPRLRIFITHGGLYSLQEAIYHGKPVIGIPVANDQGQNLAKAEKEGFARVLQWEELSEETFKKAIQDVLQDMSYAQQARHFSELFRDQPETPLRRAVYWVEYIIRHKGAGHLRSPAVDLKWYQRTLMDVFTFIGCIIALSVFLGCYLIRAVFRAVVRRPNTLVRENKKNR